MTSTASRWTIALGLVGSLGMAAGQPAALAQVSCGDTISGSYILTSSDPITAGPCTTNPALTITGPGSLDLNGFEISCQDEFAQNGVVLEGEGAELRDGSVTNCVRGVRSLAAAGTR